MKKVLSLIMALCMITCLFAVSSSAEETAQPLKFGGKGKFNILHLCDCQDTFPAHEEMFAYINYMLENYNIDLVVYGGDNTVGPAETKYEAIEELVKPCVDHQTYFTMVFGNHDHQQGVEKPELFEMYQRAGKGYFLGYDCDSQESTKVGTHYLTITSGSSDEVRFCLYMFDSGNYVYDDEGNELGYDCVDKDQIEWYKGVRDSLKEETGRYVPSIAFQHIVPGDVYDYLYFESPFDLGELGRSFNGKHYSFIPKLNNFTGLLNEPPCPGYYNLGQMDALAEKGDMLGVFVGHDHVNSYDVEINGVHVINTPGITYHSYSNDANKGANIITLDDETGTFSTELVTISSIAANDADFAESVGLSTSKASFNVFLGNLMNTLRTVFSVFGLIFK